MPKNFIMELTLNQKVWEININKVINSKSDLYKNGITIEEYNIIGINSQRVCINNLYFSSFDIRKKGERRESHYTYLNESIISIKIKEDYFGKGVFIKLYSTKKPNKRLLSKMVAEASFKIDSEYGFLLNGAKDELYNFIDQFKF